MRNYRPGDFKEKRRDAGKRAETAAFWEANEERCIALEAMAGNGETERNGETARNGSVSMDAQRRRRNTERERTSDSDSPKSDFI